jgi:hypothetical protein
VFDRQRFLDDVPQVSHGDCATAFKMLGFVRLHMLKDKRVVKQVKKCPQRQVTPLRLASAWNGVHRVRTRTGTGLRAQEDPLL